MNVKHALVRVGAVCALLSAVGSNQARIGEAAGEPLQMFFFEAERFLGANASEKWGRSCAFFFRSGCGWIKRQGVSAVILLIRALAENGAEVMWVID